MSHAQTFSPIRAAYVKAIEVPSNDMTDPKNVQCNKKPDKIFGNSKNSTINGKVKLDSRLLYQFNKIENNEKLYCQQVEISEIVENPCQDWKFRQMHAITIVAAKTMSLFPDS